MFLAMVSSAATPRSRIILQLAHWASADAGSAYERLSRETRVQQRRQVHDELGATVHLPRDHHITSLHHVTSGAHNTQIHIIDL